LIFHLTKTKEILMRTKFLIAAIALVTASTAAFAAQPERPGAFGRDRAAGVQSFQKGGVNDTGAPGASEWGKIASERGVTNGTLNRDYKATNGGAPAHGRR
jgi:hypothetical protein